MTPTRKSSVWKHFSKGNDGTATCRFCKKKLKTSGNTTNLISHISRQHKLLVQKEGEIGENEESKKEDISEKPSMDEASSGPSTSQQRTPTPTQNQGNEDYYGYGSCSTITLCNSFNQPRIKESFENIGSFHGSGKKFNAISDSILFMICKDMQPFRLVENEGFRHLMKTTSPLYKLPGRDFFSRKLDAKYDLVSIKIKEKLVSIQDVTITTDVWSDIMQARSFLGVTIHFIDGLNLTSFTLGVYDLEERHTAEYLAQKLTETCTLWGIRKESVTAVVTDSGANIVKAIDIAFGKHVHISCCAHTLNLVVERSVENVPHLTELINKVKKIVTWFKKSIVASDELRKMTSLKMIQEVPTRWNSKYYMLERFLKLRAPINEIVNKHVSAPPITTALEIQQIQEVIDLLLPLEAASKELCGEKYITASKIIPLIHCLSKKISTRNCQLEIGIKLKNELTSEIKRRFGHIEEVPLMAFSTILDPRFKKVHFENALACSKAITQLQNLMMSSQEDEDDNLVNTCNVEVEGKL
jgi:hypothetical protein